MYYIDSKGKKSELKINRNYPIIPSQNHTTSYLWPWGGHTHIRIHTCIHIRIKVIIRNQACNWHVHGKIIFMCLKIVVILINYYSAALFGGFCPSFQAKIIVPVPLRYLLIKETQ